MRRSLLGLCSASLVLAGCVQTRQFADVQFAPPRGDYDLLVMRPDITVNSVTTGGLPEPRADWTDQARSNVITALKAQQGKLGGKVFVADKRDSIKGVAPDKVAEIERLNGAVANMIALHRYFGDRLPTKRGQGLDWTLGEDARALGAATGYDYALFLYAEDNIVSQGRVALQVLGIAGCLVGFCAPNIGGGGQFAYASLADLKTGEVVWFNILSAKSDVAGVKFGDIRTREGATQMVDRLIGRMKAGRDVRRAQKAAAK